MRSPRRRVHASPLFAPPTRGEDQCHRRARSSPTVREGVGCGRGQHLERRAVPL